MKIGNRRKQYLAAGVLALLTTLSVAGSKKSLPAGTYEGEEPKDAAAALLAVAQEQADNGSWELIAVGRIYYLSGDKQKGQAIFDRATSKKPAESDMRRIAAVYNEAKEYDKTISILEKALAIDPKEPKVLAELGAAYNLNGDRKKAEELFARSFQAEPDAFWDTVAAAGSYLGVRPD